MRLRLFIVFHWFAIAAAGVGLVIAGDLVGAGAGRGAVDRRVDTAVHTRLRTWYIFEDFVAYERGERVDADSWTVLGVRGARYRIQKTYKSNERVAT